MLQNSAQISFNNSLTKYTHHFTETSEESYREPVCAQHLVFLRLRHLIGRKINLQRCVRYRAPCGDNNSCHVAPWRLIKWMDRLGWMDLRVLQGKVPLAVLIKVNQVFVEWLQITTKKAAPQNWQPARGVHTFESSDIDASFYNLLLFIY